MLKNNLKMTKFCFHHYLIFFYLNVDQLAIARLQFANLIELLVIGCALLNGLQSLGVFLGEGISVFKKIVSADCYAFHILSQ